jgi:hypothetical protein
MADAGAQSMNVGHYTRPELASQPTPALANAGTALKRATSLKAGAFLSFYRVTRVVGL